MLRGYKPGDILKVVFSGLVDGQIKPRPVVFWKEDSNNPNRILVSGIFGTATGRKWECKLFPRLSNGLTKESVVRIDNTQYIDISTVLLTCGSLDSIEFNQVKRLMMEYSNEQKTNSPEAFGDDPFEIF